MTPQKQFRVELRERPPLTVLRDDPVSRMFKDKPRYMVLLNGRVYDSLNFHTRGYVGYLPELPDGRRLFLGEMSLERYQREVDRINQEASHEATHEASADANADFDANIPSPLSEEHPEITAAGF